MVDQRVRKFAIVTMQAEYEDTYKMMQFMDSLPITAQIYEMKNFKARYTIFLKTLPYMADISLSSLRKNL